MNLQDLINKINQKPLFVIDNWSSDVGFVCFEYEEIIIWNHDGLYINIKKLIAQILKKYKIQLIYGKINPIKYQL